MQIHDWPINGNFFVSTPTLPRGGTGNRVPSDATGPTTMFSTTKKYIAPALMLALALALNLSTDLRTAFDRALTRVGVAESLQSVEATVCSTAAAAASATTETDGRYELAVTLKTRDGEPFEWRTFVTRREYVEAEQSTSTLVRKYTKLALQALARRMGYFEQLYGDGRTELEDVALTSVRVSDLRAGRDVELVTRG